MKTLFGFMKVPYLALLLFLFIFSLNGKSFTKILNEYGLMHLNEWKMFFPKSYLGTFPYSNTNPPGGSFFPVKGGCLIYLDGLVWSGFVRDGRDPALQAGGTQFRSGVQPGWIVKPGRPGQAPVAISTNNERVRMYRWRKDFFTITEDQLRQEAALLLMTSEDSVSQGQIDTLYQQYLNDLQEWPADLGAPYYDRNQNGQYDPEYDEPGLLDADQLIWYVVNDLNNAKTLALFGSLPMGLEVQVTIWNYKVGLSSVVFRRYRLINKSGFTIDSMYVGQFVECDLGNFTDDLVGCDSTLGYGFAYNGYAYDEIFNQFAMSPPALGVVLLQGPIVPQKGSTAIQDFKKVPGYQNLPMTSFWYAAAGDCFSYPILGQYQGTLDIFANLMGYGALYPDGTLLPFYRGDKPEEISTPWPLAGNPVTGQGDVDGRGYNTNPSNRSFMVNSGPFSMQPGQVQDIIFAYVAAYSLGNHLDALATLQKIVPTVKRAYREFLNFVPPVGPRKKITAKPDSTNVEYFLLAEGYPNPFHQSVKIKFRLLNNMDVRLDIFNSAGQRVKTLYRGQLNKGVHDLQWDGTNQAGHILPSGIYFVRLKHGPLMRWKKVIMLK